MMVVRKRRDLYCQLCSFITGNFYPTLILGGGGITWPPGSAVWLDEFINFTNCLTTDWLGVGDQEVSVSLNKYKYWSTWLNVNLSLNSQHQSQLHLQTSPLSMRHHNGEYGIWNVSTAVQFATPFYLKENQTDHNFKRREKWVLIENPSGRACLVIMLLNTPGCPRNGWVRCWQSPSLLCLCGWEGGWSHIPSACQQTLFSYQKSPVALEMLNILACPQHTSYNLLYVLSWDWRQTAGVVLGKY